VTRLWPDGQPIAVVNSGQPGRPGMAPGESPSRFKWRSRWHQVTEITKVWRVDLDWWRIRVWRSYYKLRTDTGLLVVVYQDLTSGEWYLQRLYD